MINSAERDIDIGDPLAFIRQNMTDVKKCLDFCRNALMHKIFVRGELE